MSVEPARVAESTRADFEARACSTHRLVWMRHERAPSRDVAGILGAQVLAVMDAGTPVAYANARRRRAVDRRRRRGTAEAAARL